MEILFPEPGRERSPTVAIFGVGLVGGAVRDTLHRRGWRAERVPFDWAEGRHQERALESIGERLLAVEPAAPASPIHVLWAAGRAGFESSAAETAPELATFRRAVAWLQQLAGAAPGRPIALLLVSSIGGLFEGQRQVEADSRPRPLRPYGELKWAQERVVEALPAALRRRIVRLTSVFGAPIGQRRRGLIPTLLENAELRAVTAISGRLETLRDFVWREDVGRYLADLCVSEGVGRGEPVLTLASGRPASIHEILQVAESVSGRSLYARFATEPTNRLDITVSPLLLPPDWHPTDLATAVLRTLLALRESRAGVAV